MTCPWGSPPGPGAWGHCFPGSPLSWDYCRGLGEAGALQDQGWLGCGQRSGFSPGCPLPRDPAPLSGSVLSPLPTITASCLHCPSRRGASLGSGACRWQLCCVQLWLRPEMSVMLHLQILNSRCPETTPLLLGVGDDLLPPPHAPPAAGRRPLPGAQAWPGASSPPSQQLTGLGTQWGWGNSPEWGLLPAAQRRGTPA